MAAGEGPSGFSLELRRIGAPGAVRARTDGNAATAAPAPSSRAKLRRESPSCMPEIYASARLVLAFAVGLHGAGSRAASAVQQTLPHYAFARGSWRRLRRHRHEPAICVPRMLRQGASPPPDA